MVLSHDFFLGLFGPLDEDTNGPGHEQHIREEPSHVADLLGLLQDGVSLWAAEKWATI